MGSTVEKLESITRQIEDYYEQANAIMLEKGSASALSTLVSKVNLLLKEFDKVAMNLPCTSKSEEKEAIDKQFRTVYARNKQFDVRVGNYLKSSEVAKRDIESILNAPPTLRSHTSRSRRSTHGSTSSSVLRARAVANQELARLRLQHLQEELENKKKFEEMKRQHQAMELEETGKIELLRATQELKEASLEREVIEEELDRGGYIDTAEEGDKVAPHTLDQKGSSGVVDFTFRSNIEREKLALNPLNQKRTVPDSLPLSGTEHVQYDQLQGRDKTTKPVGNYATTMPHANPYAAAPSFQYDQPQGRTDATEPKCVGSYAPTVPYVNPAPALRYLPLWETDIPKIEILKFSGDPTKYTRFIKTFEANVEISVQDSNKRLLLLLQHCEGEAKRLIEFCLLLSPDEGYLKAKDILKDHFGRKNLIARSYMNKLHSDVSIKADDGKELINLAYDLEECEFTFRCLNLHSYVNNFDNIVKIVNRLPYSIRTRWVRAAAESEKRGCEPSFNDLVEFVKNEAEIAKSVYAKVVENKTKKVSKFQTHSTSISSAVATTTNKPNCYLCFGAHKLWDCCKFREKNVNEKISFMRQNRLCDNCFKKGHIARYCRSEATCTVDGCRRKHHSLLHQEQTRESKNNDQRREKQEPGMESSTVAMVSSVSSAGSHHQQVSLNIIPVRVTAGKRNIETYAFLDQGSTTTLCDERLLEQLNVHGEDAIYSITTINRTTENHKGKRISLCVSALQNEEDSVNLANVYSVQDLPVTPNKVLSKRDLKMWPHLQDVSIPVIPNGEVLLLIGVDVPEVFWTIDEKRGSRDEPFAIKTVLGWSVIGATQGKQNKGFRVNYIRKSDELLQKQVECLWKLDSVTSLNYPEIEMSKNDRYALHSLAKSKEFVNGHYQLPLLWKPGAPCLTSNHSQAVSRLHSLKKRFEKDKKLRDNYTDAMQDYLSKGFAEVVNPVDLSNNDCWYLPHHCVLHPHKPDKFRVVFDCAARHRNSSLNEQLLPGPDLLQSLVGVLLRFRQDDIALVSDIQSMFHQVLVKPEDRNYLRFLWWPKGNMSLSPVDYCMKVHVFGAKSSPTCAIYALQQTAKDHAASYPAEVVQTVLQNFYMDDCLKSVPTVGQAVELAERLTDLLKRGGFRLRKWLSNDKRVLSKIPSEERSSALVNLKNFDNCCEQVLGIQWDVHKDLDLTSLLSKNPLRDEAFFPQLVLFLTLWVLSLL